MKETAGSTPAAPHTVDAASDVERAITLRKEGVSAVQIAIELGVDRKRVRRWLRDGGLDTSRLDIASVETRERRRDRVVELYGEELSMEKIGALLNISSNTVQQDLRARKVRTRKPGAPRKHPEVGDVTCARDGCENRFTPQPWRAARGHGRYCSRQCASSATHAPAQAGGFVTCEQCGAEHWFWQSWLRSGTTGRFCSHRCWWDYRRAHGVFPRAFARSTGRGRWGGLARQKWGGRWAPKGGRPPTVIPAETISNVIRFHERGWGYDTLAPKFGLSRHQVREIVAGRKTAS